MDGADPALTAVRELPTRDLVELVTGSPRFWPGVAAIATRGYGAAPHAAALPPPSCVAALQRRGAARDAAALAGADGVRFTDGPRGVVMRGATTFPVAMARGATWDAALERRVGEVVARESLALGANLFAGICINLLRHPAWGRAQETYGADPHHVGEMALAATRGVQASGACLACAKHFALNSMENARFTVDVRAGARALHEVYLPHFERVVREGRVASVMSAYNSVNGAYCGENAALLNDTLKKRWGFTGFVMSDFVFGVRSSARALESGMDLEMPFRSFFDARLARDVAKGAASRARLEDAAARVLRLELAAAAAKLRDPALVAPLAAEERARHSDVAREVAEKAIVLLKNERAALPLPAPAFSPSPTPFKVHVLGALADRVNLGDRGSSCTQPGLVETPLEALRRCMGAEAVSFSSTCQTQAEQAACLQADAVLVVVGRTWADEGEYVIPTLTPRMVTSMIPFPWRPSDWASILHVLAFFVGKFLAGLAPWRAQPAAHQQDATDFGFGGDVDDLHLRASQEALIERAAALNKRVVVVLQAGSAVLVERWVDKVPAVVMAWYGGERGGEALARVLTGAVSPSGKLPFSVPARAEHLPSFDRHASKVEYDLFHDYRMLDRDDLRPLFPLGFGLSYTRFALRDARLAPGSEVPGEFAVAVEVAVENVGARAGAEVVQAYVETQGSRLPRARKELKAFARVELEPGQVRVARLALPRRAFEHFDEQAGDWALERGCRRTLILATCADDLRVGDVPSALRLDVSRVVDALDVVGGAGVVARI